MSVHDDGNGTTHVNTTDIFVLARSLLGCAADWADDISHPVEMTMPVQAFETLALLFLICFVRATKPDLARAMDILGQVEKDWRS